jgi:hypothetical protein
MLLPIEGTHYVRDVRNRAIINKDSAGLEDYKMKRKLLMTQQEEINKVKTEMNSVKTELTEIKELLKQVLLK